MKLQPRSTRTWTRRVSDLFTLTLAVGVLLTAPAAAAERATPPAPTRQVVSTGNPIIADGSLYTADAAPLVGADGRFYVYTGHDEAAEQVAGFVMDDYTVLATDDPDSGAWDVYEKNLVPGEVFAWASGNNAYAGQATIGADGRYYWYVPVQSRDTTAPNAMAIGVAVSDSPVGPWMDAIGEPLVDWNDVFGTSSAGQEVIDPHVFTDDDGSVFLYWGSWGVARMVELDPNMVARDGEITTIPGLDGFYEAPWVVKRGSTYHMVYDWKIGGSACTPSNYQACIGWATAASPTGPWTYEGLVMDAGSSTTMHPSLVADGDRWYLTYHTKDAAGGGHFRRSVAIDEVTWDGDRILPIKGTRADDPAYRLTDNVALYATPTASFTEQPPMRLGALNDGFRATTALLPADMWGGFRGTTSTSASEWISYTWDAPVRVESVGIQFHEDPSWIRAPESWRLDYLDAAGDWKPVTGATYPAETGRWLDVGFGAVTTSALRVTVENRAANTGAYHSVAVSEWEVGAVAPGSLADIDVSTRPGVAPALPPAVRVSEGGATRWASVTWRDVASSAYAKPGSFEVQGRVLGAPERYLVARVVVDPDATPPTPPADGTAPEVSIALRGTEGGAGWYSSDVIARVRSEDTVAPFTTIDSRLDSAAWSAGTEPRRWTELTVTSPGVSVVAARATDEAGNTSTVVERTVKIDKTAPQASAQVGNASRTTTVTGSDALSGLGEASYRFGRAGAWQPLQLDTPVPAPDGQPTTMVYRVADVAGNVATGSVDVPADPDAELTGNLAPLGTATASSASSWAPPAGLNDGTGEPLVDDASTLGASWGTWPVVGEQSAVLTWDYDVRVDRSGVWWSTDAPDEANAGLIPPRSWVLEYLDSDGTTWREVTLAAGSAYGRARDTYNQVSFAPVTTRAMRLRAQSWGAEAQQGSVGISEWQVIAAESVKRVVVAAAAPSFADPTCLGVQVGAGTATIPTTKGAVYLVDATPVTGTLTQAAGSVLVVTAQAAEGYALAAGSPARWEHRFSSPTCVTTPAVPTTPTATTFASTARPELVGRARVGSKLKVKVSRFEPTPTKLTYRWFIDGKRLAGRTGRTLLATPQMVGRRLSVRVTASAPGFRDLVVTSRARTVRPR